MEDSSMNRLSGTASEASTSLGTRRRRASDMDESAASPVIDLSPVEECIVRLLSAKMNKTKKAVHLPAELIWSLLRDSRNIFLDQPSNLELLPPINIVGDLHGHFYDLLTIFQEGGHPPAANWLLLGDYVDRGQFSIETLCLCLCFKIKFPNNFFMLRGNHECAMINRVYGFYDDCKRRYDLKLWKGFTDLFNCLPLTAVVDDRIFCVHAGLSPNLLSLDQINSEVERPKEVLDHGLACDLLWADPEDGIKGFGESGRGVSFTFGADVIEKFLKKNNLDLICRAHQVVEDGYQFFASRQLVTIFSAPNYCGEFDNAGAFMHVETSLMCSFKVLLPDINTKRKK